MSHVPGANAARRGLARAARARVYALLREPSPKNFDVLARAVAADADTEGLLLLVELENKSKRSLISRRPIEGAVTEHVPSEHWKGPFDVLPVSAADPRSKLLALTTDGGVYDTAARVLTQIDKVRDDYGPAEGEPRHPNLAAGRPWPIMAPDPDAEDGTWLCLRLQRGDGVGAGGVMAWGRGRRRGGARARGR